MHDTVVVQDFQTSDRVLEGLHKIAVAEITAEASVRRQIREVYIKHAVVSTGSHLIERQAS